MKMRSYWVRVDPKSHDWCPSVKRRGHADTLRRRRPRDGGGGDGRDAATSQGTARLSGSHQKLQEVSEDSLLELVGGARSCGYLDFGTSIL